MNRDLQRLSLALLPLAWVALHAIATPPADLLPQAPGLGGLGSLLADAMAGAQAARAGSADAYRNTDAPDADEAVVDAGACNGAPPAALPLRCRRSEMQARARAGQASGAGP